MPKISDISDRPARESSAIGGVRTSIVDERTDAVDERPFIDDGGTFPRKHVKNV